MTDPSSDIDQDPPRHHYVRWIVWSLIGILVLGGLVWYFMPPSGQSSSGGSHAGKGRYSLSGPMPVGAAIARKGDIDVTRDALGTVTPIANVTVRTQISGQLQQIAFQEGQIVQQGDFLAQIDPRPYQFALEQAQGALARDQALLDEARLNLARYKKLVEQDSIARQQLDTQESLVTQDQGNVQTDQSQIDTAKLNLIYCHIVAPVSGRVGLRQVDQGNYVQVSDTNGIVTITQLQPITVIFTVPEDVLPAIMKRLAANAELTVTAYDRTQSTKLAAGKLISVDNQIDTSTGTIKIRAQFDNADNVLFPNQFVNVELLIDTLKDATVIPSAAIQRGTPGTFVYLIGEDNKVKVQVVKLGPSQGDNVAITDGLSPGDKVVVDGADKLRDGAKVTLPAEKDSSGPSKPDTSKGSGSDDASKNSAHTHHRSNQ